MTELEKHVQHLNELIMADQTMQAMEQYYADEVIMQENEEEPRRGIHRCLEHEAGVLNRVKEIRQALLNQAIDPDTNIVFSEWEINMVTAKNKRIRLREVSVQHWEDGKVVKEKFYYKGMDEVVDR